MALSHRGTKGGQVGFFKVARGGVNVEAVTHGFRAAVHGKVFAGGHCAEMIKIAALNTGDKGYAELAGKEGIFAVGLLAAAPARIAKDVDVGRPEGESVEDAVIALALSFVVLASGLGGDDVSHGVDDRWVPGGGHADGLRKDRGVAGAGNAVEGFVPGLIVGNAKTWDGGGPVFKLVGFFFEGHAAHQIMRTLSSRELGVEVGKLLREGDGGKNGADERQEEPAATRHELIPPKAALDPMRSRVCRPISVSICGQGRDWPSSQCRKGGR